MLKVYGTKGQKATDQLLIKLEEMGLSYAFLDRQTASTYPVSPVVVITSESQSQTFHGYTQQLQFLLQQYKDQRE